MPNLDFEVRQSNFDEPGRYELATTARIRAVNDELRGFIRALVGKAVEDGRKVAEREAPRGPILARNEGQRIRDAIRDSTTRYSPGGAGGGGFWEADLTASGTIAPHLRYVFEGTKDEGRGLIRPARGNILAIQKEGEAVHFRPAVHGQKSQSEWWDLAREAVEATLQSGIDSMDIQKRP